jgi:hypothetical protein
MTFAWADIRAHNLGQDIYSVARNVKLRPSEYKVGVVWMLLQHLLHVHNVALHSAQVVQLCTYVPIYIFQNFVMMNSWVTFSTTQKYLS